MSEHATQPDGAPSPESKPDYTPIPNGGWKLLGAIILVTVVEAIISSMTATALLAIGPAFPGNHSHVIVFTIGAFLVITVIITATSGSRRTWLGEYWRRNVIGYAVAYWSTWAIAGQVEHGAPISTRSIHLSGPISTRPLVIIWPLGGWLHRPKMYWSGKRSAWSIARTGNTYPDAAVRITDRAGNTMGFDSVADGLTIIAEALAQHRSWSDNPTWSALLVATRIERDDLRRDLAVETQRRDHAAEAYRLEFTRTDSEIEAALAKCERITKNHDARLRERNNALVCIHRAVETMRESTRLRSTVEGLRLYVALLTWILDVQHCDDTGERHSKPLREAHGKLAQMERRERRRRSDTKSPRHTTPQEDRS